MRAMKRRARLISSLATSAICLAMTLTAGEPGRNRPGIGPSFKGPVGLQLYSLRAQFARDVDGTLDKVRELGFRNAELAGTYNLSPDQFKEKLAARRLRPIAGHFDYERWRDDLDKVVQEAKALGLRYAGCAWIPHEGAFDEKACRAAIGVFNRAGEALAKENIKFFYHQHGYEFAPCGQGTLMDLMIAETRPETVAFEMDIFWVVFPGQDPVKLFEKHGQRWELVHLKDMKKGTKTGDPSGHTDVNNDVALGAGQMDMPAILRAAKAAGVKCYFIEDESDAVLNQLPQSLKYLEQVQF
jgi:sugar phosphate isomerase/epimerase